MKKRREINVFSISFLDLLSGALGAVIILYVAIPKNQVPQEKAKEDIVTEALIQDLKQSQSKIQSLEKQLALSTKQLAAVSKAENESVGKDFDIGFKFRGKNIVFIIDTSYSMVDEDRMGQVKAGIKMLLTALPPEYNVEVVQFPFGERAPFRSLWGVPKEMSGINKNDAFDFIYRLRPAGGTPTRDALLFVLRNYGDLSDIVLLSDGVPTYHNTNRKDDIYDILKAVREENLHKIQINTIGVGSDFNKDKTSDRYKFLSLLSQESGGFFVGF